MTSAGLRELRRDASDLIRRVEAGEVIDITVSGRLAARIVPARARQWQPWNAVADCFAGRADDGFERDRELVDQSLRNPEDLGT